MKNRTAATVMLVLVALAGTAGCGKRGDPYRPSETDGRNKAAVLSAPSSAPADRG